MADFAISSPETSGSATRILFTGERVRIVATYWELNVRDLYLLVQIWCEQFAPAVSATNTPFLNLQRFKAFPPQF
jgi:hypothetical protein